MKILKLSQQPATNALGRAIVNRKIFFHAVENGVSEIFDYTTEDVLFGGEISADPNIQLLQYVVLENQIQTVDALIAHMENPPRLYPVFLTHV